MIVEDVCIVVVVVCFVVVLCSAQYEEVTFSAFKFNAQRIKNLPENRTLPIPFLIVSCVVPVKLSRQLFSLPSIQKFCISLFLPTSICLPSIVKFVIQTPSSDVLSSWIISFSLSIWSELKQCSNALNDLGTGLIFSKNYKIRLKWKV